MKFIIKCIEGENYSSQEEVPIRETIVLYFKKDVILTKDRFRTFSLAKNTVRSKSKQCDGASVDPGKRLLVWQGNNRNTFFGQRNPKTYKPQESTL